MSFGFSVIKNAVPFVVLCICGLILWPQISELNVQDVQAGFRDIAAWQWGAAAVFTASSFYAISQYDVIAHRHLNTGVPAGRASCVGAAAIALSQLFGFGFITGGLARWRMMPDQGPQKSALITGFVSLMFLAAMLALTSILCLALPVPQSFKTASGVTLAILCAAVILASSAPHLTFRGKTWDLPSLRACMSASGWAGIDVLTGALALYVLIPTTAQPEVWVFIPVAVIAIGAGLYSGTPGGAGPFELTLLAMTASGFPAEMETAALMVAILAFRVVYSILPGLIAVIVLLPARSVPAQWDVPPPPSVARAPRAETGVIRQNGGSITTIGSTHSAIWPTAQTLTALFDPFERFSPNAFRHFKQIARNRNKFALLYKCSRRTAFDARRAGWSCLHIADEAIISLPTYKIAIPSCARLRRKLKKVQKSHVNIRKATLSDMRALASVDRAWQAWNGRARGGTMGRFDPGYILDHAVFVAENDGLITAFVTFHRSPKEWALDLMRQSADTPDGVMHALVHAGILEAQALGVQEVCLSAVPACPNSSSTFWRAFARKVAQISGAAGLRQFKSTFSPTWRPVYAAAPGPLSLAIGLADVTREVFMPPPIAQTQRQQMNKLHEHDERYEVASHSAACQAK